jgi:hypothetical protein
MLALAYPGPSNTTTHLVGRDAFLDALDNHSMRVRILEREPSSLDEALSLACRFEAYDRTCVSSQNDSDEDRYRTKFRHVRQVTSKSEPNEMETVSLCSLSKQLSELRQIVDRNQVDIERNQSLIKYATSATGSSSLSKVIPYRDEGNFCGNMNNVYWPNGIMPARNDTQVYSGAVADPHFTAVQTRENNGAANHVVRTSTKLANKGCFKCVEIQDTGNGNVRNKNLLIQPQMPLKLISK